MTFQKDQIDQFLNQFQTNKARIRAFEGCTHLELWRDTQNPCVFYTYSHWDSEAHLNLYRNSDLFKEIWGQTKILFAEKPLAFSVSKEIEL